MPELSPQFDLADRVRKAREYAGFTQQGLADETGMARSGLAQIEQGKTTPRRSSLKLIALATGVDQRWLETGETPTGGNPGGGNAVRHQGLEPRTHCFELIAA